MRRKEREVSEIGQLRKILDACEVCRIALAGEEEPFTPYIVPLNFGYKWEQDRLILYFHGAGEGRKMDLVRQKGLAGFEMDTAHCLLPHDTACGHTYFYQSITGFGRICEVTDPAEKKEGLGLLMKQLTRREDWEFAPYAFEKTTVLKLEAEQYSGKQHLRG